MPGRLIEVKIAKATLFLTAEEFTKGIKRGKAIKRRRSYDERAKRRDKK